MPASDGCLPQGSARYYRSLCFFYSPSDRQPSNSGGLPPHAAEVVRRQERRVVSGASAVQPPEPAPMARSKKRPATPTVEASPAQPALLPLFVIFLWMTTSLTSAFNLDTQFPVVLRGAAGSHFGYSVALHAGGQLGMQALVGAIRANSSHGNWHGIHEPGVLYRCPLLEEGRPCVELLVDATGNEDHEDAIENMRYKDLKDNMTLGMALDVSPDGSVVVCAPLWKNQKWYGVHLANGACYVLDRNLRRPKKLVPLVKRTQQSVNYDYYYYAAELGFSAAFTEDGRLVLGIPGFYNWEGSITRYNQAHQLTSHHMLLGRKEKDSYKGYSVTTGRLFQERELTVAAGSPRGADYKGQVLLFGIDGPGNDRGVVIKSRLSGSQMCEYFGSSLLATDLDGDGIDDLLVGAPMHSIPGGQDEGRVYVYRSNGVGLYASGHLEGHRATAARFGTSIAKVGDLNLDGIQDVAVGAPYENDVGAVYIYHGSPTLGERTVYAQRIDASTVSSRIGAPLKGFGISISKGLDVDANHYDDVLVGSYMADNAVLFRSRPIAQLRGVITPEVGMITADMGKCEISGGSEFSCFKLNTCIEYTGKFVNNTADVEVELTLDVNRKVDSRLVRGFMFRDQDRVDKYSSLVQARKGHTTCESRLVYLDETFVDPLIPFAVRMEYRLRDTGDQRWCPTCPVPDRGFPLAVTKAIPYQHGCGSDEVCRADLKLDLNIIGYDGSPLVVGERRDLSVSLFLENAGATDPAYLARVLVTLPDRVRVVNKDRCSVQQDPAHRRSLIVCDAGNPLRPSRNAFFLLKLDMSQVEDTFNLTAEATTTSEEATPNDNKVVITLPFVHQADISMLGKAKPEVVTFNAQTKAIQLEHGFVLAKLYASPIQQVQLSVRVPYVFSESEKPIAFVKQIRVLQGDLFVPGTCRNMEGVVKSIEGDQAGRKSDDDSRHDVLATRNGSLGGRVQRSVPEHESPHSEKLTALLYQNVPPLNCKTSLCHEIRCNFGPFLTRQKIAQIILSVVVNMEEFTRQAGSWYAFSVGSEGYLKILDNTTFLTDPQSRKEIRVATVFQKEGPPPAEKVATWIIAASAFSGLILFSLIIAGLVHLGFFRRRQREALEKLLQEENDNEWNEFTVTKADVEAEKEFFRKSMMIGAADLKVLQEQIEGSTEDVKDLG
ncbi:integrin alpha-9-like isoform X2 [Dermacentor albipictus]|uniref:integrin alpha-9-like isoform X2 n=1 Tax=Dermacentor albipictus TaxID=60249 RepID=UPI0031FD9535